MLSLLFLETQIISFSNHYVLMARVLKEKEKKAHRYSRVDFRVSSKKGWVVFLGMSCLSLISGSKSGSWLTQKRQNSHWYKAQAVIYIGCEYNCTQWPTKFYLFIGKIIPSDQFLMAHNVMQCSGVLGLSQLWYKNKLWVLLWPPVLMCH